VGWWRGERERNGPLDLTSHLRTTHSYNRFFFSSLFLWGRKGGGGIRMSTSHKICISPLLSFRHGFPWQFPLLHRHQIFEMAEAVEKCKNFRAAAYKNVFSHCGMLHAVMVP
jgi:hypothetical protein